MSPVAKIPANSPIGTANPKIVPAFKGEAMPTIEELMAKLVKVLLDPTAKRAVVVGGDVVVAVWWPRW